MDKLREQKTIFIRRFMPYPKNPAPWYLLLQPLDPSARPISPHRPAACPEGSRLGQSGDRKGLMNTKNNLSTTLLPREVF